MLKFLSILVVLIATSIGYFVYKLSEEPELPQFDLDRWWADGKPTKQDTSIRPFKIEFNDSMIHDLKQRLKNRRPLTRPLEGIQSEYGMNTDYLEGILNYWHDKYDFKKREAWMNTFEHYKTRLHGLDIHFVRGRPKAGAGVKVLPLLILHGWPSSSREFYKVIPLLTKPRDGYDFVFDVVAPDLPGFGFSEGTNKPGLSPVEMGIMMRNLMHRLGYKKFYVQGGDWGSQVATHMATIFQDELLGFHTNMPLTSRSISFFKLILGSLYPPLLVDEKYEERMYPLSKFLTYVLRESGYYHMQATKPDTIGVGLTDSPAGLASYVMEKMAICTNSEQLDKPHGGLGALDIEDVLDTLTITWTNNCIVTSMRIYAEGIPRGTPDINILHSITTKVPTAALNFRYEVLYQPDSLLKDKFPNLVHSTAYEYGGHFAGMQTPNEMAKDVFSATKEFIRFHSRNSNKQTS